MMKWNISALIVMAAIGVSASANALTLEEMKKPGSAVVWYQDDADMKELDVADYLYSIYAKKDVSDAKINQVEACINKEMAASYPEAKESDVNAPSLYNLLKKCKA